MADITAKALTVSGLTAQNKPYDGSRTATYTGTAALQSAATAAFNASSTDGKPYEGTLVVNVTGTATATFGPDANVGTAKPVVFTGLSITGPGSGNYTLTPHADGSADITAKQLTISELPTIVSRVYDRTQTPGALTIGTLVGLVGSETLSVSAVATDYTSADVGSYTTTVTYSISQAPGDTGLVTNYVKPVNGSAVGEITAKQLTISAPSIAARDYNGLTTAGSVTPGTLIGLVSPETLNVTGAAAAYTSAEPISG